MKKKIIIVVPVLLIAVAGAYKLKFAPKPIPPKMKIEGTVVPMQKEFLVNLAQNRYAKVSVALIMAPAEGGAAGHGAADAGLPQEAAVRAIITDELTGIDGDALISREGREKVLHTLEKAIHKKTDEHVEKVLFTDITVQ
jgi:flagellar FliL protein